MHRAITALAALILLATTASAQNYPVDRGSILVGGSAAFQSQGFEDVDDRVTTLTLNPNFGYFIIPNLAVGGEGLISRTSSGGESITSLGIGPYIAYFFGGPQSRTFPFIQAGVAYSTTSFEGVDLSGLGADVSVGAAFMVARNAALTAEAFTQFVSYSVEDVDESVGSNTYGVRAGVAVFLF